MTITRKELKEFKQTVILWLRKHKIDMEDLNLEGHTSLDGYIVCWRKGEEQEHVIFIRDTWHRYERCSYCQSKRAVLKSLRKGSK